MENSQAEKKKGKRIFKNEISLRELWGNIKHTNICIIGALEGEEKEGRRQEAGGGQLGGSVVVPPQLG